MAYINLPTLVTKQSWISCMTLIDYRLEWNGLIFALGWAVSMWTQLIMIVLTVYPIMFFYTIINNSSTENAIFYCQKWSADHTELVQETGSELLVTQNVHWLSCVLSLLKKLSIRHIYPKAAADALRFNSKWFGLPSEKADKWWVTAHWQQLQTVWRLSAVP